MSIDKPADRDSVAWAFSNALANRRDERIEDGYPLGKTGTDWSEIDSLAKSCAERLLAPVLDEATFKKMAHATRELERVIQETSNSGHELLQSLTWSKVQDQLGEEVVQMMLTASKRHMLLLNLLPVARLGWRPCRFLSNVSRCFLFGFDAECVIMCRCVIDGALQDTVRIGKYSWAKERLTAAKELGLIDEDNRALAEKVLDWGNKCVHDSSSLFMPDGSPIKPELAILCTTEVLKALYPGE